MNLKLCSVKENTDSEYLFCFELVSVSMKKPLILQADSELSMMEWITTIRNITEKLLYTPAPRRLDEQKRITIPTKNSTLKEVESTSPFRVAKDRRISQIIENNICADCGGQSPSWISLNLGVIICLECSGIHRRLGKSLSKFINNLGPAISKVRSLKLDNLSWNVLEMFSKLNTNSINKVWEGLIEKSEKITSKADCGKRESYIRKKYVEKAYVWPLRGNDSFNL